MQEIQSVARTKQWRVSAPHSRPRRLHADEPRRPYATAHARKVGASTTACGLPAAGWPILWELTLETVGLDVCPDYARDTGRPVRPLLSEAPRKPPYVTGRGPHSLNPPAPAESRHCAQGIGQPVQATCRIRAARSTHEESQCMHQWRVEGDALSDPGRMDPPKRAAARLLTRQEASCAVL